MNGSISSAPEHASPPLSQLLSLTSDAVQAVRKGRSLTEVLAKAPPTARAGVQALSFAVLRRLGAAQALRQGLAPRQPPPQVEALLITALALLWPDDHPPYPDHTLVDQTVTAARKRMPAAASFVNAVLRRFLRERDAWVAKVQQDPVAAWNHPLWWIERLRQDWPTHWQALLQQAHQHPPMALRVHAGRGNPQSYLARLALAGIAGREVPGFEDGVLLERGWPVERLPGFAQGDVSVQDLAAQRAAGLLLGRGLPPGARVLDACAAPGGKTAHLLERADLNLLALDSDAGRLSRVKQTLDRVGAKAELKAADARQVSAWWDGQPFDAILLDAPCSASGIVRRHPDIAWLRRPEDISALAQTQAELLDALWPLLKPGGRLVYATCSVFKAEGQQQIDAFLQRQAADDAWLDPDSPGHCLPLPDNGAAEAKVALADGFFYALLHKRQA
ncbi:MAG: 16S rRNA (cytosine(967)-C(5))-methyltransferase RsmB [Ideonella sp. MAG2]|nr:MAG: 16S rRNA (cytosine(967)-C(5))-methyltransferase RsmB [Ideonella sp. MAG2]